jgi:hypothetical protein
MKSNIGIIDAIVRMVLGIAIGLLGYYYGSWWALLSIVPLSTAYFGFCPLYKLFGISTCKNKAAQK